MVGGWLRRTPAQGSRRAVRAVQLHKAFAGLAATMKPAAESAARRPGAAWWQRAHRGAQALAAAMANAVTQPSAQ
ncbi:MULTISPECIES: hypothetical protein [unclassified Kitasatospora]|uniref:hypothetical protein n=1 Tax=unclassified Kitasatospora TaxID=2633591 RepID=UPI0033D127BE